MHLKCICQVLSMSNYNHFFRKKDYSYFSQHEDVIRDSIANVKVHNLSKSKYKETIKKVSNIENGRLLRKIIQCFK